MKLIKANNGQTITVVIDGETCLKQIIGSYLDEWKGSGEYGKWRSRLIKLENLMYQHGVILCICFNFFEDKTDVNGEKVKINLPIGLS
jgi:hypothetical protein